VSQAFDTNASTTARQLAKEIRPVPASRGPASEARGEGW